MQQTLRYGSQGPAVRDLQSMLNTIQSALGKLDVDGVFGQRTRLRVIEFQSKVGTIADGIVGPGTWRYLTGGNTNNGTAAPTQGGGTATTTPSPDPTAAMTMPAAMPANEKAARERIVQFASEMFQRHGGWKAGDTPTPGDLRVAGKICANRTTRERQGGKTIHDIFTVAGGPAPQRCLTLTPQAEAMYARSYTAQERNNIDIVSWCGIFALYCHKMAGLRASGWPLKYSIGKVKPQDEYRIITWPQPGDIGVVNPTGLNHHFVVIAVDDSGVTSVDGNSGAYMEIIRKTYPKHDIKQRQGYFLTPIWERVLGA